MKKREWLFWVGLTGYYTILFFLSRGIVALAFVLGFVPFLVTLITRVSTYKEMVNYLSYNHPEAWGKISRDRLEYFGFRPSILVFDEEVDDPDYRELRNQFRKFFRANIFSFFAWMATAIYAAATTVRH